MTRADAHMHLFAQGYRRDGLPSLFGDAEVRAYEALREIHGVAAALAVGYEGADLGPGNNAYLRSLARTRPWLKTVAYVPTSPAPEPQALVGLLDAGHVGLSIYALEAHDARALGEWPRACWEALQARRAVVSVNARPAAISALAALVGEWPGVSFLFAHLGLPGVLDAREDVGERLAPLLALAAAPNAVVKISGLYATSRPPHAFPHAGATHAVARILRAFGPGRCVWGSDFAPAQEHVSFAQTLDWPGAGETSPTERAMIEGGSLMRLLAR